MDALTAMKQALYVIENELSDYRLDNPHVADEAIQSIEDLRQSIKYMEKRKPVAWLNKKLPHMAVITKPDDGGGWFPVYLFKEQGDIK